jgi:uncharacterized protein (DUF58 family)
VKTEAWLYLIGGVLIGSLLLREPLLFILSLMLLFTAAVTRLWERYCLVGLGYRRRLGQTRAFFGEDVSLTLEIANDKPLPLAWLEVEDAVPGTGMRVEPAHTGPSHMPGRRLLSMLLSVRWYERVRRHYRIHCGARGFHMFGPATLRTGDVFGFATQELEIAAEDYLLVYPKLVTLERLGLPAGDPFGDIAQPRQWLFEDPLRTVGVRDYRPGDSPRRLHWKATARAPDQQLQVKLFEPTTTHRLMLMLNASTSVLNWAWQGYDPILLEAAITTSGSVARWAVERGFLTGLTANARAYRSRGALRIPPNRDPRQLTNMLEALAKFVPIATMDIESLVELEGHDQTYGTTIVVVTCVVSDALVRQLRRLRRGGHRPVLLVVGGGGAGGPGAVLNGVFVHHVRVEDTQ